MWHVNQGASVAVVVLGLLMLTVIFGCTSDNETPSPTSTVVDGTTEPTSSPTATASPTPVPPTYTPTPTATPLPKECAVGLRIEPGETCFYADDGVNDFRMMVGLDGTTMLEGSVGPLEDAARTVNPGEKLCACGLSTETDGLARIIKSLPAPDLPVVAEPFVRPIEPWRGECKEGMELEPGQMCLYPRTQCVFEVTTDGTGIMGQFSDDTHLRVTNFRSYGTVVDFRANESQGVWIIEDSAEPTNSLTPWSAPSGCLVESSVALMITAIRELDVEGVRRLLDDGVDPSARDDAGVPILERSFEGAVRAENFQVVRLLIDGGANVNALNQAGSHILRWAIALRSTALVQILLDAGADPGWETGEFRSTMTDAVREGNIEMVELFLKYVPDGELRGNVAYELLPHPIRQGHLDLVQALLDAGADLNSRSARGNPPLLSALTGTASPETLQFLLDAGAEPNVSGREGRPIFFQVLTDDRFEKLLVLLEAGADPNACDLEGNTALHLAADRGDGRLVDILLSAGADPNARSAAGDPVLGAAIIGRNPSIVKKLVDSGANVNAINSEGHSMLQLARDNREDEILQYLIDAGAE